MKNERKRERKKANRILGLVFVAILIFFFVANIIKRDRDTSDLENRSLAQRPAFTWQSVSSGTYMDRFESYVSDQFFARNVFREIDTGFSRFGGSREENDVLHGRKRQLMEDIAVPDADLLNSDVTGINQYAQEFPDVSTHILLVPDAATILPDQVPMFATVADQKSLFQNLQTQLDEGIVWMDALSSMENHTEEKLYYKTDNHWTTRGAYEVFLDTASDLGIEDPDAISYEERCVAYDFNGTLSSTSGFMPAYKEAIDVFLPEEQTFYLVNYDEEATNTPSIYSTDALDTRDKYAVFMGGNHSLVTIDSAVDNDRVLLVVKDSFANCYIPFLIPYYSRIVVVDPRYCVGTIEDVTYSYAVTDTLFLYSGNTFFTDTNLKSFLGSE